LEYLKIGTHDLGHTANLGKAPELVESGAVGTSIVAQCLQCHVEANLVPILETVGDGLCRAIDSDPDALNEMLLDAFLESPPREADDP
jgi:hypothetical protein